MTEKAVPQILILGLAPECKASIVKSGSALGIVEKPYDLEKLIEQPMSPPPQAIFCGPAPEGMALTEVAQALRMQYQTVPLYFITGIRAGFERKDFKKNGFTDAFLIPLELTLVDEVVCEIVAKSSKESVRTFKTVKLVDVTPGEVLDFDTFIYLPANKKHIKYSQAGEPLEKERAEKLVKHHINSVEIDKEQMQNFYRFTAAQLKKIGSATGLSATERQDKMQMAIRDLMGAMFNDSSKEASTTHGKLIVNDCQEIVKSYVLNATAQNNGWYDRILSLTGGGSDTFSHAANVSTFAALFSMGLGIGKPEELAMAGILHDIGLVDVPAGIQLKPEEKRAPEERKAFEAHVAHSLKMIQERKLVVSTSVIKAVEQHHERFDGSGYPKGAAGKRIAPESQLLALANEFEKMTRAVNGQPQMSPAKAMAEIARRCSNPATAPFDPDLLKALAKLFPASA
jgi:HD-GYP domain-containing protein (c-di-GMP phosphodiesterase class II)